MKQHAESPRRPLEGIRIIDMSTVLVGPMSTQLLADHGAEVIKVEPAEGDVMRYAGPMRNPKMGPMYLQANKNKQSVVLDIRQEAGRDALLRLVSQADAFVTNTRPAAMRRRALDYAALSAVKADLIYMSIVGYGQDGPYAAKPAVDDVIQAASGMASLFATRDGTPAYVPMDIADRIAGMTATSALLMALLMRERTGIGQMVEVPMFEAVAYQVLGDHMGGRLYQPDVGPMGYRRLLTPARRPFRTQDSFVSALIYTERHWSQFLAAVGHSDLPSRDERFRDAASRAGAYDHIYAWLVEIFKTRSTADWMVLLEENDIPSSFIKSTDDLLEDEHLRAVNFFEEFEHPTEGKLIQPRVPIKWSHADLSHRHHAPGVGEQSSEVLSKFGFSLQEIRDLQASNITV